MSDNTAMDNLLLERRNQEKQDIIIAILNRQTQQLDKLEEVADRFNRSMPGGDPDGHRKYHELVIKEAEDKANFRKAVIEKSIASLVWTFVVFIGSAMLFYVKTLVQTIKL